LAKSESNHDKNLAIQSCPETFVVSVHIKSEEIDVDCDEDNNEDDSEGYQESIIHA
jgi:hypothetical protein